MNHRSSILSAVPLIALLSACAAGPDYKAPEIAPPERFVLQDVLETLNRGKVEQPFSADWWRGFSDPVLDGLVGTGLESNYRIAAATARVKQAEGRLDRAGAGDNLSADVGVEGDVEERLEQGNGDDSTTTSRLFGTLGLLLPLDLFGRTTRDVEAARAALEAARAELRSTTLDVSADIAREYLRLRGNQRQLALLRESVALQEKTLSIVRARFEAGLSPELDLRRAETSVENLRADIPPLVESLVNSRNRLAILTGQYPGFHEQLLSMEKEIPVYEGRIPAPVPLDVLNTRPDVRRAEGNLKQTIAAIGIAETEYYPNFRLTGQISVGTTDTSSAPSIDVLISSLGFLIDQVITAGGARAANVEIATAQAEEALADYERTLRAVSEEVETALAALRASRDRQASLEKAVASSTRSFRQAESLYQLGLISFLDVVDAQRVLASAEQQLAAERTNYATQIAVLFRALGIGTELESGVGI